MESTFDEVPSMPYILAEYVHLDGTKVTDEIIGVGGTGLVVRQGQRAVKIPYISREIEIDGRPVPRERLTPTEGDYDVRPNLIWAIENEKAIYKRLGGHPGLVRCHNLLSTHHSIQMDLMSTDLRHHLDETNPVPKTRLCWLITLARTMAYIHSQRVIISDVRSDNVVLDEHLGVRFIDFSESTMMPLDWNLDGSDDLGFSHLTDIGQFGAMVFEVVTNRRCKFDIFHDWEDVGDSTRWPRRQTLPSTSGVWLGQIIERCWDQGFRSATDLAERLELELENLAETEHNGLDSLVPVDAQHVPRSVVQA